MRDTIKFQHCWKNFKLHSEAKIKADITVFSPFDNCIYFSNSKKWKGHFLFVQKILQYQILLKNNFEWNFFKILVPNRRFSEYWTLKTSTDCIYKIFVVFNKYNRLLAIFPSKLGHPVECSRVGKWFNSRILGNSHINYSLGALKILTKRWI